MIRGYLPAGAKVKRDRGRGLYISREPVESSYFDCVPHRNMFRLYPAAALLEVFEALEPKTPLNRAFLRFRGLSVEEASRALFCEGAKLVEAPEPLRLAKYERALRQRAAACMRMGGGGGLYACSALLTEAPERIAPDQREC